MNVGIRECAASRLGAGGQRTPVDSRSANTLGGQRWRDLYGRRRPVRQPALKTVRELDGSVDIPIRSRIFPIQLAGFAGSRRLFPSRPPALLPNYQSSIPPLATTRT